MLALAVSLVFQNLARADHETVREDLPTGWRHDAELNDVFFLDANLGWAVGAHGTILKTENGGQDWQEISQVRTVIRDRMQLEQKVRDLQAGRNTMATGVTGSNSLERSLRCRFESVYFADEKHGWVAGGYQLPYIDRSHAVLLMTRDGGKTWNSADNLMVSGLRKIQFHSSQAGWAIGDSGNLLASGIYTTSNGGQSWSAETSQRAAGWRDALPTERGFVTLDRRGILGRFVGPDYEAAPLVGLPAKAAFYSLAAVDTQHLIAVGTSGTVAQSNDQGQSWQSFDNQQLPGWLSEIDLRTVAVVGETVWFAGNPGTHLLGFDRVSGNLRVIKTAVTGSINQIRFVDPDHGWAVGENGTILATSDGGTSWQRQRGESSSVAGLFVAMAADQVPLELINLYATEENRLCGVAVISATDRQFDAVRQSVDRLGVSHVSRVDVDLTNARPADLSQQSMERLRRLVRTIRSLQPAVIVCNSAPQWSSASGTSTQDSSAQVREAIRLAADRQAYPDQLRELGLTTHQVARLVVKDPAGPMTISPTRLLPRTGELVEDQIGLSRALLGLTVNQDQPVSYREIPLNQVSPMRSDDLFSGLSTGRAPVRKGNQFRRGSVTKIKSANQRSSQLSEFSRFEVLRPNDLRVWQRNVVSYAGPLEPMEGAQFMMRLHERYRELGKIELAARSAELLVARWSNSPYAPRCLMWLGQLYASDELGKLVLSREVAAGTLQVDGSQTEASKFAAQYTTTPQRQRVNGLDVLVWTPTQAKSAAERQQPDQPDNDIELVDHETSEVAGLSTIRPEWFFERGKRSAEILQAMEQLDPDFANSADVQWMKARLSRQLVGIPGVTIETYRNRLKNLVQLTTEQANNTMLPVGSRSRYQSFRLAAVKELSLVDTEQTRVPRIESPRQPHSPTVIEEVALAEDEPTLDGQLDESMWTVTEQLKTGDNLVAVAADREFLYLAVKCTKLPNVSYQWQRQPRPRDADLARRDRIMIELDIDRDYQSVFQLEIDHRGWANERCHGLPSWNPDWFIAQSENDHHWIIEAAIPLAEIAVQLPDAESPWAVRVSRLFGDAANETNSVSNGSVPDAKGFQLLKFPAY